MFASPGVRFGQPCVHANAIRAVSSSYAFFAGGPTHRSMHFSACKLKLDRHQRTHTLVGRFRPTTAPALQNPRRLPPLPYRISPWHHKETLISNPKPEYRCRRRPGRRVGSECGPAWKERKIEHSSWNVCVCAPPVRTLTIGPPTHLWLRAASGCKTIFHPPAGVRKTPSASVRSISTASPPTVTSSTVAPVSASPRCCSPQLRFICATVPKARFHWRADWASGVQPEGPDCEK